MHKKIFALTMILLLVMLAVAACAEKPSDSGSTEGVAGDGATERNGKDPAEEQTEIPAPKKQYIDMDLMVVGSGTGNVPLQIWKAGDTAGAKFKADFTVTEVDVVCPSFTNEDAVMAFKLYKWDTDYETTVAAEPIWIDTETGYHYEENTAIIFEIEDGIAPAGTYLWLLEGVSSTPGMWSETDAEPGGDPDVVFYHYGKVTNNCIISSVHGYTMTE